MYRAMPILAICSSTKSLQSIGRRGFQTWIDIVTDIATYRLSKPRDQFSVKKSIEATFISWYLLVSWVLKGKARGKEEEQTYFRLNTYIPVFPTQLVSPLSLPDRAQ